MRRIWNDVIAAMVLVRLGQELGTASPTTAAIHDGLQFLASVASAVMQLTGK